MRYAPFMTGITLSLGLTFSAYAQQQDLPIRPNNAVTPGAVGSTDINDICGFSGGLSYSKRHRRTSDAMKQAAYHAYGIQRNGRSFEVDHRIPLCIGGADAQVNLWPQEGFFHPNYLDKDKLEDRVCEMICREQTMSLHDGQALFMGDWIAAYQRVFGQPVPGQ